MAFETDSPEEREDERQMERGIRQYTRQQPDPAQKRRALAERLDPEKPHVFVSLSEDYSTTCKICGLMRDISDHMLTAEQAEAARELLAAAEGCQRMMNELARTLPNDERLAEYTQLLDRAEAADLAASAAIARYREAHK